MKNASDGTRADIAKLPIIINSLIYFSNIVIRQLPDFF